MIFILSLVIEAIYDYFLIYRPVLLKKKEEK